MNVHFQHSGSLKTGLEPNCHHFKAFMLIATGRDILLTLDTDAIIDKAAEKSDLLRKVLL